MLCSEWSGAMNDDFRSGSIRVAITDHGIFILRDRSGHFNAKDQLRVWVYLAKIN